MRRGLSLIEVLILLIVLAVLCAVGYVRVMGVHEKNQFAATIGRFGSFERAIMLYHTEWHALPGESPSGVLPPELRSYINATDWQQAPPIGDNWDWNGPPTWNDNAHNLAIWDASQPRDLWRRFDQFADDGSTYEGKYRIWDNFLYTPIGVPESSFAQAPNDPSEPNTP